MVELGDIAEIKLGKMLDREKHTTGHLLPYLNNIALRWNEVDTSNLPQMYFDDDELDRFDLRAGDVVVCEGGEPGRSAVWDGRLPNLKFQKAIHRVRFKVPFEQRLLVLYLEAIAGTSAFESLFTGAGIRHLTRETFARLKIPQPSLAEQRKIVECLGSLDELIVAEGRKLEALRTHKRGLMQHLFPREGETRPRLRFPEFRDSAEWESRELGPMTTKVGSGITPLGGDKNYKTTGRPFVRSQNVGWGELLLDDVAYIDEETHGSFDATELRESDVLLNITGASIGRSAVADVRIAGGNVNQHVCIIRVKPEELVPSLLNQYLISEYGQKQIDSFQAGGNRQGLNFAQIRSLAIALPPTPAEQQRIAGCLSAMDAVLAGQSQQLSALKKHKQALMQQLFPSPDGD